MYGKMYIDKGDGDLNEHREKIDFDKLREVAKEFGMLFVTTSVITLFNDDDDLTVKIHPMGSGCALRASSISRGELIPNKHVNYATLYSTLREDLIKIMGEPEKGTLWKVIKAIEEVDGVDSEDRAKLIHSAVEILSPIEEPIVTKEERVYLQLRDIGEGVVAIALNGRLRKLWSGEAIFGRYLLTEIDKRGGYIRLYDQQKNRVLTTTIGGGTYLNKG